jgi:uncharacterized membrane protein YkoI
VSSVITKPNLATAAALVLALGALAAVAQTAATDNASATGPAPPTNQLADENPSPATIKRFASVKATMLDAIKAAEQESGGKAFDVDFVEAGRTPAFVVDTYGDNLVTEHQVDADSGQLKGQGEVVPESEIAPDDKAALTTIGSAKTSLSQAIKSAEDKFGGKAIDAGLAENNGPPSYDVLVVHNGRLQQARVNVDTGAVAALQAAPGGFGSSMQQ